LKLDIIRLIQKKDHKAVYDLQLYLNNYCAEIYPHLFTKLKKINKKENPISAGSFVIEHDGEIVGFFSGYVMTGMNLKKNKVADSKFIVEEYVIKKEYQNKQYGEKLFTFLEEYAGKCGCERITLETMNEDRAFHFYGKMGMNIECSTFSKKIKPVKNIYDRHEMLKEKRVVG
jgi:ribosomal protein S18 acetylase RimI-like enzyme